MLAAAGGIGLWGATLFAPRPAAMPPALAPAAPRAPDNGPVALWFGKDEALRTQISVLGVIAGNDGAAVLSVDGGPPSAWRLGDEIAPGIAARHRGRRRDRQARRAQQPPARAPHAASARRDHAGALTHIAVIFHVHNSRLRIQTELCVRQSARARPPAGVHPDRDHGGHRHHGHPGGPDRAPRAGPARPGPAGRRAPGHRRHHAGAQALPARQRPLSDHDPGLRALVEKPRARPTGAAIWTSCPTIPGAIPINT